MKKIDINFSSYRPRLKVRLNWTTDLIPNVGDEIIIGSEFISELDKKYFPEYMKNCSMTFRIKKRIWNLSEKEKEYSWQNYDVRLELDWAEAESVEVEKYLEAFKKERENKKIKEKE